jgi:hypothetical protein
MPDPETKPRAATYETMAGRFVVSTRGVRPDRLAALEAVAEAGEALFKSGGTATALRAALDHLRQLREGTS